MCLLIELSAYENYFHKKKGEKGKRGIENSVRKYMRNCQHTRVSITGEWTVLL